MIPLGLAGMSLEEDGDQCVTALPVLGSEQRQSAGRCYIRSKVNLMI